MGIAKKDGGHWLAERTRVISWKSIILNQENKFWGYDCEKKSFSIKIVVFLHRKNSKLTCIACKTRRRKKKGKE